VTTDELFAKMLDLSARERAWIALQLIRSLDEGADPGVDEIQGAEIDRLGVEVEAGSADRVRLAEYLDQVRRRRAARARR
jgi:hypothetical protein